MAVDNTEQQERDEKDAGSAHCSKEHDDDDGNRSDGLCGASPLLEGTGPRGHSDCYFSSRLPPHLMGCLKFVQIPIAIL